MKLLIFILLSCCHFSILQAATWKIVYPRMVSEQTEEPSYPVKLLELALQQTGVKYELTASEELFTPERALKQLSANRDIDIYWSLTDNEKEQDFKPIRIPIYKGLTGWRVFFIHPEQSSAFEQVGSLTDLLQFNAIQGFNWPDTSVLRAKQFEVATAVETPDLFALLNQGEGDFFPRSIIDIWSEYEVWSQAQPLQIESQYGLQYPTAMYFFVNTRSSTLHHLIEIGLERAVQNGQFDALFSENHATLLAQTQVSRRTFFKLENPNLPTQTPLEREELWFKLEQAKD